MPRNEVVVCDYPSKATRLARWRVVFRDGQFYLQWIRGFAYPPRVTSQQPIDIGTARAHWNHAPEQGGTALHWKRLHPLIKKARAHEL